MKIPFIGAIRKYFNRIIGTSFNTIGGNRGIFNQVGRTPVTERTSFGLSAYYAGVRLISESIAMLPVEVFRREGGKLFETTHPTEFLLNAEANFQQIAFDCRQIMVTSALNWGNGLAIIERNGSGTPIALINVRRESADPIDFDEELFWDVRVDSTTSLRVPDRDMLNIRGFGTDPVIGLSIIELHRQNLGLSIAAQDYGQDFYNKRAKNVSGYIEFNGTLDPKIKDAIADQWSRNYGPSGERGVAILDQGSKFVPVEEVKPADAQFIETRKFQKNEIATILGIPPHMINEMESATFSNIEHQGIQFITYTLQGWLTKIEQEYRRKLLKQSEKINHIYSHDTAVLAKADLKSKGQWYKTMSDIGVFSPNDIRKREGLNKIDGLDDRYIQLNRININDIDEFHENNSGHEDDDDDNTGHLNDDNNDDNNGKD